MGKENDLGNFEGFGLKEDIDFFGESLTKEEKVDQNILIESKDEPEETDEENHEQVKEKPEETDTETDIDKMFAEFETGEEEGEESEDKGKSKEEKSETKTSAGSSAISSLNYLKEKGLIDFELKEGEELTEEVAEALLEDDFDARVEGRIEEIFETQHPMLKQLNKFAADGGDVEQFFSFLAAKNAQSSTQSLDMKVKEDQITAVRHGLAKEGYDKDYIDTQLKFLEESGNLEKFAQVHYKRMEEERVQQEQQMLEQAKMAKQAKIESRRKSKAAVKTYLNEVETVKGLKVTRTDKNSLPSYIADETLTLEDGSTISPLRADLMTALADKEKVIVLAKLLRSDFNLEKFMKSAETAATKNIKDEIKRTKERIPSQTASSSSQKPKSFADYF